MASIDTIAASGGSGVADAIRSVSLAVLNERAKRGDCDAIAELRRSLNEEPEQWEDIGNLARQAERAIFQNGFDDGIGREAVRKHMGDLRLRLLGAQPSVEEELLVDRVVLSWLQLHQLEASIAQALPRLGSREISERYKWLDRAHRRYLSSIRSLAQVRKLLGISIQVNIAEQQVNVNR